MNASIRRISYRSAISYALLELTLCVCNFVEAETHPLVVKSFPYKIPSFWRNMIILLAKDLHVFKLEFPCAHKRISVPDRPWSIRPECHQLSRGCHLSYHGLVSDCVYRWQSNTPLPSLSRLGRIGRLDAHQGTCPLLLFFHCKSSIPRGSKPKERHLHRRQILSRHGPD